MGSEHAMLLGLGATVVSGEGYRYWRIYISSLPAGSGGLEINELCFGDASQVTLTTTNCNSSIVPAANTYDPGGTDCRKLTDNYANDSVFGSGTYDLHFLGGGTGWYLDLVYPAAVEPVYLRQARRDTENRQVDTVRVDYSSDGVSWSTLNASLTVPQTASNFTFADWVSLT